MFLKVGDLAAGITGKSDGPNWLFHCTWAILIDPPNILLFGVIEHDRLGSSLSRIQAIITFAIFRDSPDLMDEVDCVYYKLV